MHDKKISRKMPGCKGRTNAANRPWDKPFQFVVATDEENDSNIMTSDHDIISGLLREEFGPLYPHLYPSSTQTGQGSWPQSRGEAPRGERAARGEPQERSRVGSAATSIRTGQPAAASLALSGYSTGRDGDISKVFHAASSVQINKVVAVFA